VEDVCVLTPEGSSSRLYGARRAYINNPCQILNFDRESMSSERQLMLRTVLFVSDLVPDKLTNMNKHWCVHGMYTLILMYVICVRWGRFQVRPRTRIAISVFLPRPCVSKTPPNVALVFLRSNPHFPVLLYETDYWATRRLYE